MDKFITIYFLITHHTELSTCATELKGEEMRNKELTRPAVWSGSARVRLTLRVIHETFHAVSARVILHATNTQMMLTGHITLNLITLFV